MNMLRLVVAAFMAALIVGSSFASPSNDAISRYLDKPTDKNAVRAIMSIGASRDIQALSTVDLLLIRNQVVSGSAASLRLVFAMLPASDGGSLEDLMALVATSIRPQPQVFLEEVVRAKLHESTLEAILLMPGPEYVDRPQAKNFEIAMRRRAIATVKRRDLLAVRERCRLILDRFGE